MWKTISVFMMLTILAACTEEPVIVKSQKRLRSHLTRMENKQLKSSLPYRKSFLLKD
ncbi:hypothetical protein [Lentibacillus salicampi]|uniref:hypothetical protein n=1 Tax=Lentibacillus salicampi TaxID=175306 RepID=UPI001430B8E5|nr:hypothetical protein [Lentibacillus salicampi]